MRTTWLILVLSSAGCLAPPPGDEKVGSIGEAATVCAAGATVTGIDVSGYQGTVNWSQVAASGRKFGIAKATEGTNFIDSTFATNWSEMKKAGIIRSAYHFFHPGDDPTAQADYFVKTVGALDAGDLPLMLDLEVTDNVAGATVAANAITFLKRVETLTGKKPIVYTYPGFWSQIGNPGGFNGYPLNIANYGVSCPDVIGQWGTWVMWQYSSTGSVSGVSGQVDEDYFNGDLAALQKFAGGSGTTDPCLGLSDGSYCGGDGITGDKSTLFVCKGGTVSSQTKCAAGCKYNPPGTPDECNPAPPAPDGGTGGGGGGGSGGGTGGGAGGGTGGGAGGGPADNPGGGSGGGTGTMPGASMGGCSMSGAPTSGGVLLLGLMILAGLALRRRAV
jgi:MYXO-CTERM domain-containing protein